MDKFIDNIIPLGIAAVVVLVALAVAIRLLVPVVVRTFALRKASEAEREALPIKKELLAHPDIIEALAPAATFRMNHDPEKKKRKQLHWVSPYPEAVRKAYKRPRKESKTQRTLVRTQVHTAARAISVATLPDSEQPANAGPEHFSITFQLNGLAEAKLLALAPIIKSQLGLHSLDRRDTDDYRAIRFVGHTVRPEDKLTTVKPGTDFFETHPASSVFSIPLAIKEDGTPWSLPTHHTLIHGRTGSGKGSPIQGIVRQMEPFLEKGLIELYGVDPKNAEFKAYAHTSIFKELALGGTEVMSDLIRRSHQMMKDRQEAVVATKENDFGRTIPVTTETPMVLILIDELLSLLGRLNKSGKKGQEVMQLLTEILAQGRSANIFVIAATQAARQELMGDMRDNFVNFLVLKLKEGQTYWNDFWLGEGAAAAGFDATKILTANQDNGYATAGIGYVVEQSGDPVKVRFARTDKDAMAELFDRHPRTPAAGPSLVMVGRVEVVTEDLRAEEDDGGFGFIELPDSSDNDNDGLALPALD